MSYLEDTNCKMGETVSALCESSARGLARFAAIMANRGCLDGKKFISEATWELMHLDAKEEAEPPYGTRHTHTRGGVSLSKTVDQFTIPSGPYFSPEFTPKLEKSRCCRGAGWYCWGGIGGSIIGYHPEHKLGFSYVPADLILLDITNKRSGRLEKIALECAEKIAKKSL